MGGWVDEWMEERQRRGLRFYSRAVLDARAVGSERVSDQRQARRQEGMGQCARRCGESLLGCALHLLGGMSGGIVDLG